jgi:hypothetical protein
MRCIVGQLVCVQIHSLLAVCRICSSQTARPQQCHTSVSIPVDALRLSASNRAERLHQPQPQGSLGLPRGILRSIRSERGPPLHTPALLHPLPKRCKAPFLRHRRRTKASLEGKREREREQRKQQWTCDTNKSVGVLNNAIVMMMLVFSAGMTA